MKYLVLCTCGHSLANHDVQGCRGEVRALCECRRDGGQALEAAIEQARVSPWGYQLNSAERKAEAG